LTAAEVVSDQVPFGEGPVWCDDGTLVCTSVSHGALFRVEPASGRTTLLCDTGGGANGAAFASDGSFVVTQNGGIDLVAMGHIKEAPPVRWMRPGLQRAFADGAVEYLTSVAMQAPNDLVVAAEGTVYFTDPGPVEVHGDVARIVAFRLDGSTDVVAGGFSYVNGIALDPDGTTLVVVEAHIHLLRFFELGVGERELAVENIGETGGDGFCLDVDGNYYVAVRRGNGIRVFDPAGKELDFLGLEPGNAFVSNCCFGGDDLRTLFATDARRGRVVAWEGMPVPGLPLNPWPAPAPAS
jgi:gluconolactonase